ncbi:MAG: response regulator [Smithellaceae bacterium]
MPIPLKVLLVEDSEDDALLVLRALQKGGFEPVCRRVETAGDMADALSGQLWDIVLCDFKLPQFDGLGAIDLMDELSLDIPILIVSGSIGEEMAVECMRRGANDYIMKDNLSRLCPAIHRELAEAQSRAQRREAEAALQESEEKFKTIADYTVNWESWFSSDGTYLWVNPAVERLTGYSAEEVLNMQDFISVMIAEEDRDMFRRGFQSALTGTRGENFEVRYRHKNGSTLWLSVSWQPVYGSKGVFLGIRTSGRDISAAKQGEEERRYLEKKLLQAQKMEAIGTLAGGIAHDFNNILSGIIGYAELAAMQADENVRQNSIAQVLKAAQRATNLVKQILAFSRHVELEKKPMDLRGVVDDVLKLLRAAIPTTIEMHQALPDQPVIIFADYTQMHQVLMNICTNAAHAMGEKGGRLAVSLSEETLRNDALSRELSLPAGMYTKLSVADTGQGIDPAHMPRLFDPFFTTKKVGEGTGLGLAVVYGIIHDHGGGIQVSSLPGQGATFDVYLPLPGRAARIPDDVKTPGVARGHEHILFVDDERDLVFLGKKMLSDLGYHVTICTDGLDALETFRAAPEKFDLIITDMNMPMMSGSQLSAEILKIRPELPIILCTGYSDYMDSEKATAIGIAAFVMKPLTRSLLTTLVREVLDKSSFRPDAPGPEGKSPLP